MIIQTERCYLRKFEEKDAPSLFALNSNPEVLKYTGDKAFENVMSARKFIRNYQNTYVNGMGRCSVCLKTNDAFIGWCGLKYHHIEKKVDLGYRFFQSEWNKGYATETAQACVDYAFKVLQLEMIIARARPKNTASIRVMKKIGMRYLEDSIDHGDEIVVYHILNIS